MTPLAFFAGSDDNLLLTTLAGDMLSTLPPGLAFLDSAFGKRMFVADTDFNLQWLARRADHPEWHDDARAAIDRMPEAMDARYRPLWATWESGERDSGKAREALTAIFEAPPFDENPWLRLRAMTAHPF